MMSEHEWIRIAFDGPPSHESGRFVEVETEHGNSISFGEWVEGENGLWYLQFPNHANEHAALKRALRHAHYRTHKPSPEFCSGCEEIEALLKEPNP